MVTRLSDHLAAARRRLVVGRTVESASFRAALESESLPFHLLYIYGPGGVGKTTLLTDYMSICEELSLPVFSIDARNIEPTPDAFLTALQSAMGITSPATPFQHLAACPRQAVVLVDTYEILHPLDDWLCRTFFPQLPENVLIVLAGREPLSSVWRADPGWQMLIRVLPLRNLSPADSQIYLTRRNIPIEEQPAVLDFTHGHPLALSLVADVFAQRKGVHFRPEEAPDVVKALLEQFVQKVPGPAHRAALEACALVRVTTEPLLAEMLGMGDLPTGSGAHDLFEWLRSLSFIESGRRGLFPHDLARESLVADLRWRNPDWYSELHHRARNYFTHRINQVSGSSQQQILLDYVYLHRDNPAVRPFFQWQHGAPLPDSIKEGDTPNLITIVQSFEGEEAAEIAAHWFSRQPGNILVLRSPNNQPVGVLTNIRLQGLDDEDLRLDPAIRNAWEYLQRHAPLRPGEVATHFRFWMARDTYQAISPIQSLIGIHIVRHYLTTPGLAFNFFPVADPEFWSPLLAYANLIRIPDADFEVGGRHYGVFGHDWRIEPTTAWLEVLAQREMATSPNLIPVEAPISPLVVLSKADFSRAAQDALRTYSRPDGLLGNPLACSRLVVDKTGVAANEQQRVEILRDLMEEMIGSLQAAPRDNKFYRALYHTYLHPAPTQEAAAELLDLPFSTYRRHLKEGISRVTEMLWQAEISGLG